MVINVSSTIAIRVCMTKHAQSQTNRTSANGYVPRQVIQHENDNASQGPGKLQETQHHPELL